MSVFKISYRYAFHLILLFIISNILSYLVSNFLLETIYYPKLDLVMFIIRYIFPFILLYIYINKRHGKKCNEKKNELSKGITLYTYIIAFLLMFFTVLINYYLIGILPKEGSFLGPIYRSFNTNINYQLRSPIGFFIVAILLAPFCEEFFFRGILLEGLLNNGISPLKSILFSSFLFGAIHVNPWQIITAFFAGNVIGLVYFRTRSIFICSLLHGLNNGIIFFNVLFSKEDYIYGWIQSKYYIFIVFISFIIVLRWFICYTNKSKINN